MVSILGRVPHNFTYVACQLYGPSGFGVLRNRCLASKWPLANEICQEQNALG
jgi:hypothetical protein